MTLPSDTVVDPNRDTGRTTRLALYYVNRAIEHAGDWVYVRDHCEKDIAHRSLRSIVCTLLSILGVGFIKEDTDLGYKIKVIPLPEKKS